MWCHNGVGSERVNVDYVVPWRRYIKVRLAWTVKMFCVLLLQWLHDCMDVCYNDEVHAFCKRAQFECNSEISSARLAHPAYNEVTYVDTPMILEHTHFHDLTCWLYDAENTVLLMRVFAGVVECLLLISGWPVVTGELVNQKKKIILQTGMKVEYLYFSILYPPPFMHRHCWSVSIIYRMRVDNWYCDIISVSLLNRLPIISTLT